MTTTQTQSQVNTYIELIESTFAVIKEKDGRKQVAVESLRNISKEGLTVEVANLVIDGLNAKYDLGLAYQDVISVDGIEQEIKGAERAVAEVLKEEGAILNFRNSVIAGAVMGSAGAVLHRGINAATLGGGIVGVAGSYFVGGVLTARADEATDNQYAKLGAGALLGAAVGAGSVYACDAILSVYNGTVEETNTGSDSSLIESPLQDFVW